MSQSERRKARRQCKRQGHIIKTDDQGTRMCARCMEVLS